MVTEKKFEISPEAYERYMRVFKIIRKRVGLNIKIHNDDQVFHDGQIFLFNHFARFETAIPPYMIHSRTGAYCRSIAHHDLFGNDRLGSILKKMGAVPNNIPDLLPFLAAEILRGRKVVVFPEGGLIKDRRITDDEGRLRIFSNKYNDFIKLHRGAAVLALTLDLFKRRIMYLFEAEDYKRLEHWRSSLGLVDLDDLKKQASKPTNIVPSTITFYPIRIDDNILTKAVDLFGKVPKSFAEELAIEGNILLKDTDMDIRLGEPIAPNKSWKWWEVLILKKYFEQIDSLDDLFSLKDKTKPTLIEKTLVNCIGNEIDNVRDQYMERMYLGTTINLSHLASTLIMRLFKDGVRHVNKDRFHATLYLALKNLQSINDIHLHRSLNVPERYRKLIMGDNDELRGFIDLCQQTELLSEEAEVYKLSEKVDDEFSSHEVRLENPLQVYTNEVAPIDGVQKAITAALKSYHDLDDKLVAHHLYEDELAVYHWSKTHYTDERFDSINDKEIFTQSGEPSLRIPKKGSTRGVLLVHGFLSSPAEMRSLEQRLFEEGYTVMNVRLAGHGTSPWDLQNRVWDEWVGSVRRGYRILSAFCDEIVTIGFSTGGALGMLHASENPEKLIGVASVCAPLSIQEKGMAIVPWVNRLNKITRPFSDGYGLVPFYEKKMEESDINYRNVPVHAINEFRQLMKGLKKKLKVINCPALILQSDKDEIVNPNSGQKIFELLGSKQKEIHMIDSNKHGLIMHNIGGTQDRLVDFVKNTGKTDE